MRHNDKIKVTRELRKIVRSKLMECRVCHNKIKHLAVRSDASITWHCRLIEAQQALVSLRTAIKLINR